MADRLLFDLQGQGVKGEIVVSSQLIGFCIALVLALLLVFPLSGALKKHPSIFYIVAIIFTAVYIWLISSGINYNSVRPLTMVLQKGYLSSLLLAAVMFCGCFDEGSFMRKRLQPTRGELSILSFIFILGHVWTYLPGYLGRFAALLFSRTNVAVSLIIAMVLFVLFAILAITSIRVIHKHMGARAWKNLQRFSYLMIALLAVHVGIVLGRSAFAGTAIVSTATFAIYMAVIALYAVLRVRKALRAG